MADNKRYYWIKLKTNFFNQETIDFLLSQKNGCEYIVLYQMLCLNTANNNGEMCSKIGEMIIPYNVEKIVRDTKYFDFDTVTVALELFKKLGLIYEERGNVFKIANFEDMVGSESEWAEKKRIYREKQKQLGLGQNEDIVRQEIEYRDKSIDIDKDNNIKKKFKKPTIEEVQNYCKERNNNINAESFIDYYEANGWKVGRNSMKDWKAAVRTWEKRETKTNKPVKNEWFDKNIKKEELSQEEEEEMKSILNKY